MLYCLNPKCKKPRNPEGTENCLNCGSKLLLKQRYRPTKFIGEGVFSRSFVAEDLQKMNSACVIKQFAPLPQIQTQAEALAKVAQVFEQEAKQLVELGGYFPEVSTPYDYVEQDNHLYLIRYFVPGNNLLQEMQESGGYSEHHVREFLYDILPVLQLLHKRGIVHRSIKPTNIIRREGDRKFVLVDLGISKQLTDTRLNKTGLRTTTEVYTPIEQLRGNKAYPASDLYSLGVICIQLLTGAHPDELFDPLEGRWTWREYLRNRSVDVSDQLAQILDKLLEDSVRDRYQSASEVLKEFYAGGAKVTAPKTGQPKTTSEPESKVHGWQCLHTISGHLDSVTSIAFSPNGQFIASGSGDNTIKIWQANTGKLLLNLIGHSDTINEVIFSPQDKILASSSGDKTIKIWNLDSGKIIHNLTGHNMTVFSIAMSPDGEMLASGSGDGTIRLWHPSSGKLLRVLSGHSDFIESVAFSPNGDRLASASWDNTIRIWHPATGKLLQTLKGHSASVWSIAFSPDGLTLASNGGDNTIKIWHLESGTLIRNLTENSDSAWSIAFSADGKSLASDSSDETIKIWDLATQKLIRTLTGHSGQVRSISFSCDGELLATGSDDKTFKVWRWE